MFNFKRLVQFTVFGLLLPSALMAQEFPPKKTVTMVVGFAAGGSADTAARVIAKKLGENIGVAVVVDNKPGAGGNIAHAAVANGPTDGSVILLGSIGIGTLIYCFAILSFRITSHFLRYISLLLISLRALDLTFI